MRRRYPKYQAGGMPSGMPTDIQRLIRRMLEARTDKAEDVIPDMASGGVVGLLRGGFVEDRPQGPVFGTGPDYGPPEENRPPWLEGLRDLLSRPGGAIRDAGRGLGKVAEKHGDVANRLRGIIGFQAGGSPYRQRMQQSYVSPEVAQPYADLTGKIQQAGARPYTPYGGQRLAATTADQALARGAYGAYGRGAGPVGTQQAAATMGQAGQMIGGAYQGVAGLQPQYAQMAMAAPQMAAGGAQAEAQAAAQRAQQLENIIPMAQNQYQQEVQQAQLLQQTGAIRRDEAQRAIDEAKMRYEYQAGAPSQLLDQYIGRIQGGGLGGLFGQDQTQTVTGRRATPSFANQLLGVGSLGLGIHEAAPNFFPSIFSGGNPFGGGLFGGSNVGRTAAQLMGSGAISSANPLGTWVSGW